MKNLLIAAAVVAAAASGAVLAQSDVLKAKGCLNCHEMDKKKVGPAFKEVAAKYKDNKGAEAALVAKLKEGKGHMKVNASDAELKSAVEQVLAAK
ncbi:MAG TPA: cytochrome C' [Burkholderiales bacterium]|nr:cytochrome C' [Burkholderiales bacterium]